MIPAFAVRTWLEVVPIAPVAQARERIVGDHFTAAEQVELAAARDQTIAGFLALKRALAALLGEARGMGGVPECRIRLGHETTGAVVLRGIDGADEAEVGRVVAGARLSISHTRNRAYGLAVWGMGIVNSGTGRRTGR